MNITRRTFLKGLSAVPAVALVPSLLLAAEEVPEYLYLNFDLTPFGNRIPNITFIRNKFKGPGYLAGAQIIQMEQRDFTNNTVRIWYEARLKVLNTGKFLENEYKLYPSGYGLIITV